MRKVREGERQEEGMWAFGAECPRERIVSWKNAVGRRRLRGGAARRAAPLAHCAPLRPDLGEAHASERAQRQTGTVAHQATANSVKARFCGE